MVQSHICILDFAALPEQCTGLLSAMKPSLVPVAKNSGSVVLLDIYRREQDWRGSWPGSKF